MLSFDFVTAGRILFGPGRLKELGELAKNEGRRTLVVAGMSLDRVTPLLENLAASSVGTSIYAVQEEPTIDTVEEGARFAREKDCDLVIGYGGGSALDTGKAIAAFLTNPGDLLDYLEVVGRGQPLVNPPLPFLAVPTTAGTGSEVTRNAVLGVPGQRVKVSLRSPLMLPRIALIDPELTYSLPPEVTASTGMDALSQCIEPYVSNRANPMTDAICREGMRRAARSLLHAFEQGSDPQARLDMSLASLFGGLALANARLGAVHGFAGPIGGMFPAPHGAVCARLLPLVMDANMRALQQREPDHPSLGRFDEVARILTGKPSASAADGVAWMQRLCSSLRIPPLSNYGITEEAIPELVEKSARASSMQGNPIRLDEDELRSILIQAI